VSPDSGQNIRLSAVEDVYRTRVRDPTSVASAPCASGRSGTTSLRLPARLPQTNTVTTVAPGETEPDNAVMDDIQRRPGCRLLPPTGFPMVPTGLIVPDDLRRFYRLCGGLILFEHAPASDPDDLTTGCYVLADGGSGGPILTYVGSNDANTRPDGLPG
jgi:hypothetical protein